MSKITRQRKWLLGFLGLGVAAVVTDRAFLGGPDEANAAEDVGAAAVADVEAALGPAAIQTPAPALSGEGPLDLSGFARRLDELPDMTQAEVGRHDAFSTPATWIAEPEDAQAAAEIPVVDGQLGRDFQASHTVNGKMNVDGNTLVILDGEPIEIDQMVDGFILVQVAGRASLWESIETGERVILREIP